MSTKRVLTERAGAVPALAEAFREHGFEGASLSVLSKATGLGKGSLYNFFPGGKEEMMEAVLADIDAWFEKVIFSTLEHARDPTAAVTSMIDDVTEYFRSGRRVCLVGCIGLNASGAVFAERIRSYFARWISALARCLRAGGVHEPQATQLAEEAVSGIQGAIVLARALEDDAVFLRVVHRQRSVLIDAIANPSAE
ncbi:TetR/AcrR family transcriptional regulator [Methylobacterium sp. 13MFTsu3.1M2]|uniref:TetR/AcrR family transcriptional regulator n=1 Tax=Methylobacterium sp. 13MFTsu3.1M2 TaxID=1502776 RepID=UPI0008E1EC3B|nr:TetR/AcrR family transcriptional regulator [Methylobacterium sp. 13MFTsu3.1M2]SFF05106.1 transcriptional regulator, TetR family [Methylobacterium sp. 13MFTsu3.1M2]